MAPLDNSDPNINPPIAVTTEYLTLFTDRLSLYKQRTPAAGLFYRVNKGQPSVRVEATDIEKEFADVAEFGTGERYSASA
jgi:hypothetical protein